MTHNDRFARQQDLLPPDQLTALTISVIGVGAIGRQVALQLAAAGVRRLQLIDFDVVEIVNLGPQGYRVADLGQLKVHATADLCRALQPEIELTVLPERYRRGMQLGDVVFCCVDQIATRRHIWESLNPAVRLFIDGRMSAEVLRVLVASDADSRESYPSTLFAPQQAFTGPCTARSTIYCANVAAGLMVAQFAKWLRAVPLEADLQLNLLTSEWTVHELRRQAGHCDERPNEAKGIGLELVDVRD